VSAADGRSLSGELGSFADWEMRAGGGLGDSWGCWPPVGVDAPDYRLGWGIVRAGGGLGDSGVVGRPSGSLPPTTDLGVGGLWKCWYLGGGWGRVGGVGGDGGCFRRQRLRPV
jgi:hypothetical protein